MSDTYVNGKKVPKDYPKKSYIFTSRNDIAAPWLTSNPENYPLVIIEELYPGYKFFPDLTHLATYDGYDDTIARVILGNDTTYVKPEYDDNYDDNAVVGYNLLLIGPPAPNLQKARKEWLDRLFAPTTVYEGYDEPKEYLSSYSKNKKELERIRAEERAKMEEEAWRRYLLEQATKWKYRTWLDVNRELDSPYPILETDEERAARLAPETPEQYKARVAAELGLYHKGGRLISRRFKLK